MDVQVVDLAAKFARFDDRWHPRIVGELNGSYVKVVKLEGEFVWHHHDSEDELFLVIDGVLRIELRDGVLVIEPGQFVVIPRGVEHRPVADGVVQVVLIEPATTVNTGNVDDAKTVTDLEWVARQTPEWRLGMPTRSPRRSAATRRCRPDAASFTRRGRWSTACKRAAAVGWRFRYHRVAAASRSASSSSMFASRMDSA